MGAYLEVWALLRHKLPLCLLSSVNIPDLILPCCKNGKPKNKVTIKVKGHQVHFIAI